MSAAPEMYPEADYLQISTHEFIRRFLIHVLPSGFHRIRYYGLFASTTRADNIARARQLLAVPKPRTDVTSAWLSRKTPTGCHETSAN